jgi:RNA polymerase sigma-70 factor (ECF subfamily)
MNDGDLIRGVQAGDGKSLTIIYERYVNGIWRFVFSQLSRDREATEDLVSETFLAAIRTVQAFDPERGTVYGWLLGIARNKLRDHWRRAERVAAGQAIMANQLANLKSVDADQGAIAAETRDAAIRTLDALGDEERLALEWKYVESLSVREIAERLGRTEKAVEAILYRARLSFRAVYAQKQAGTK